MNIQLYQQRHRIIQVERIVLQSDLLFENIPYEMNQIHLNIFDNIEIMPDYISLNENKQN